MNIKAIVRNINKNSGIGSIYICVDLYTKELRQQVFFKTIHKVRKSEFHNGKLTGKTQQVKKINDFIFEEIVKIKDLINELESRNINVNKDSLVNARNESNKVEYSILEYLIEYKEWHLRNKKIEISKKTNTLINHFKDFSESKKYYSYSINQNFIDLFSNYLININLHPNTVHRHFKNLRSFFGYLELNHSINISKSLKYPKEVGTEKAFLTKEEIKKIIDYNPTNQRLINVKKLVIIQIYTGLRFSDLRRLNKSHIQGDLIKIQMQKVDDLIIIPISNDLRNTLESIDYEVKNIIISNQKYNDYIKELAELAGIDQPTEKIQYKNGVKYFTKVPKCKLLASHNMRTTFVTLAIQAGMQLNMIMKITGHKKLSTLQVYAKSIDQYVSDDYQNFTKYLNG